MEQVVRSVPGNYCRNGNFEYGNLDFWSTTTGILSYYFTPSGFLGNGNLLVVTANGATVTLQHGDYIPVREGEEVTIGIYIQAGTVNQVSFEAQFYNGTYQAPYSKTSSFQSVTGATKFYWYSFRVPNGYSFVRAKYWFGGSTGFNMSLTGANINIQDSSISIEGNINLKVVDLSQTAAVGAGAAQNSIFDPVDPNKIWKVIHLVLWATPPAGAASGTHRFEVSIGGFDRVGIWISNYNEVCGLFRKYNNASLVGPSPPDNVSLGNVLDNLYATSDNNLILTYTNNTNVTQNNTRSIKAVVIESYRDRID